MLLDFGQVHSRLFDHRPFLNGEVRYFLHEFEEARGDREIENLFSILEKTTDIHGDQAGRLIGLCESQVPSMKARLDVAGSMCQQILEPDHCANKVCLHLVHSWVAIMLHFCHLCYAF